MEKKDNMNSIQDYFQQRLEQHGATPQGADWNSVESQEIRFEQLTKLLEVKTGFTILDYGCGYGGYADYLAKNDFHFSQFYGVDILEDMVRKAKDLHPVQERFFFTTDLDEIPLVDYATASGVFNIRLNTDYESWTKYVISCLEELNKRTQRGFASNFLTSYSDPEKMVSRLYYADPCFLFDYCKKNFSKNVAILHDYKLYDFTLIVRK